MAELGMSFDANEVNPDSGFELIPEGDYQLQITEADVVANSKGTGKILKFKAEIVDGEFANRFVLENLNIVHSNPTAQKIGQEQLSALCRASGVMHVTNTDQLLYQPFWAALKHEPYTDRKGIERIGAKVAKFHFDTGTAPPEGKPAPEASAERPAPPPTASAAPPNRPAPKTPPAAQGGVTKKMPWQK